MCKYAEVYEKYSIKNPAQKDPISQCSLLMCPWDTVFAVGTTITTATLHNLIPFVSMVYQTWKTC